PTLGHGAGASERCLFCENEAGCAATNGKAAASRGIAYLLKESFEQLWSYETPGWARRFFDRWVESLRWQRLAPNRKFAKLIERHWDGIEAYCRADNKVALGFVEGLNNKIRVLQRRAYGIRDEEYFRLKILSF